MKGTQKNGRRTGKRVIPVVSLREERTADTPETPHAAAEPGQSSALSSIYQTADGRPTDLTRMDRTKGSRNRIFFILLIALSALLAVSLSGLYLFTRGGGKFGGDGVTVSIASPDRIASGGEATYEITYENAEPVALGNVELTMQFPPGFTVKHAVPEIAEGSQNAWKLENVPPGKGKTVRVTGKLVGEVGSVVTFSATLSYTPASFNSVFQESASRSVTIGSSTVTLEIGGSLRVLADRETAHTLRFANTSDQPIERLRISATYPEGYTFVKSTPAPSEKDATWEIARLDAGASSEIVLTGTFTGDSGSLAELKASIGFLDEASVLQKQLETSLIVLLVNPELTLQLAVNGKTQDQVVSFGDTLDYLVTYQNNSELEMDNVTLVAAIDSRVVDYSKIDDEENGKVDGSTITWTKEQIPALASLTPGAGGELRFRASLVSGGQTIPGLNVQSTNFTVKSHVSARSSSLKELDGVSVDVKSATLTLQVNTILTLSGEARYYSDEGEQLGSGPLPPKVNETTTYRVFWYLGNATNELQNAVATMQLSSDVVWTGKGISYTSGTLTYAPATRTVTWTIPSVAPGVGRADPNLAASFEVSMTPGESSIGLPVTLTGPVTVNAKDAFTGADRTATEGPLTSELSNDPQAIGKGTVQPPGGAANTNGS